jgi:hypothetical protein
VIVKALSQEIDTAKYYSGGASVLLKDHKLVATMPKLCHELQVVDRMETHIGGALAHQVLILLVSISLREEGKGGAHFLFSLAKMNRASIFVKGIALRRIRS